MMKRGIVFAMMLALVGFGVRAQDDGDADAWRLKSPTAEEYLAAVPSLVELGNQEAMAVTYPSIYSPMFSTLTTEIYARYPELWREDPEVIYEAYKSFRTGHDYWDDRDRWIDAIVLGWIQQHVIDLSRTRHLHILDFQVSVKGRDFDADGHDEWWLHIDNPDFRQDVVIAGEIGAYRLTDTPLPWFGCCYMYYNTRSGFMKEQLFGDINADGLPEWVMAVGGFGANLTNGGFFYVLQWRGGKLIDLTPPSDDPDHIFYSSPAGGGYPPLFPYGVHIEYPDKNRDGIREITIVQNQGDNWGCTWTLRRNYGWNGTAYRFDNEERSYNEVQVCEIRWAEEAMWKGDYQTAIKHYERGLEFPPTEEYFSEEPIELKRYITARLALAYTLAGHTTEAEAVIQYLSPREDDSATLTKFIEAVKSNLGSPANMCQAAHDAFVFECPNGTDACLGSPLNMIVGYTLENSGYGAHHPALSFPSASSAGCDLSYPVQDDLNSNPLRSAESPGRQLETRGERVLKALHFDLNKDGIEEWLVWLAKPVPALFFYDEPNTPYYQSSYVEIPYPRQDDHYLMQGENSNPNFDPRVGFDVYSTPDNNSSVLINTLQWQRYSGYPAYCPLQPTEDGGFSQSAPSISFTLWRLKDRELQLGTQMSFCKPVTLETVFGNPGGVLPYEIEADTYDEIKGATYTWNTQQMMYLVSRIEPIEPTPKPAENISTSYTNTLRDAQDAILKQQDYQKALDIIDSGLNQLTLLDIEANSLTYLRALALAELGRDDEALAKYVMIYEAAPESAWGMLAGLHLERVDGK